jgi:acyl-CoA reductase-like NAD-dependent aldehyde dehydrogenase
VGGRRPPGMHQGWFFEPTVFSGVTNSMTIAREEVFGGLGAPLRVSRRRHCHGE